jgi:hypothetical protein
MKPKTVRNGLTGLLIALGSIFPNQLGSSDCCIKPVDYSAPAEISYISPVHSFSNLARKNISDLTSEERTKLTSRLRMRESAGRADALGITIRARRFSAQTIADTIYSVGENQINISESGALEDYNIFHRRKFSTRDMLNPQKNRIVRDWYLFRRIPRLLNFYGLETTVANALASYNTGIGNLIRAGGDAINNFEQLPEITQRYIQNITRQD